MSELNYAGIIVLTAIGLIIGASLLGGLGDDVGKMTNTFTITNQSVTTAANGQYVDLTGQELIGSASVNNMTYAGTNQIAVTIEEGISTATGYKRVRMKTNNATWASKPINVTYTYGSEGYVDDAGGRAMVTIIMLGFALLLMVIAIVPTFRSGLLNFVKDRF